MCSLVAESLEGMETVSRHRFHSLCPYFAMFPESFVEHWLKRLSRRGDLTLDPFAGRGTTPFQSLLMERRPIACDVNDVAYCITRAKTNAPPAASVRTRVTKLERAFKPAAYDDERASLPEFFAHAYHPRTLSQLLHLRRYLRWWESDVDCMTAALTLGIVHGESERSPSYLSAQMPRTISTKPAYSVRFWKARGLVAPDRDVFDAVRRQIDYRYMSTVPGRRGEIFHSDMRDLPRLLRGRLGQVKHVITSPPYFDVTNFEEDQWLRLWFLGRASMPTRNVISRDDRHGRVDRYWDFIGDMWRMLGQVLAPKANIVVRIGATLIDPERIGAMLQGTAAFSKRKVELIERNVGEITNRQTDSFRPGSRGCRFEVDCLLRMA